MQSQRRRFGAGVVASAAIVLAAGGCGDFITPQQVQLQQELDATRAKLAETQRQFTEQAATIDSLRNQLDQNRRLTDVSLDQLFLVDRVTIVDRSGGADLDGAPGDDAIIVYVRPLDTDGHVIKAAGEITVQLLDLAAGGEPQELGRFVINQHETLRKTWYGGLLTDYYRVVCEFSKLRRMPRTREVHIRVTFVDWLTSRTFHDSKTVHIKRTETVSGASS